MATDPPQPPEPVEESEEKSSRGQLWRVVLAVLVLGGVVEVIIYGYLERPGWIGSSGKQFWDYLDLLIVPAALALGVYWLNRRQTERDQQAEDAQQERALSVESQRAQDEALQAYLDKMAQLLTDKEPPLHEAQPGDSLSTVARARTLTVLGRLDSSRKRSVLQFLHESRLIYKEHTVLNESYLIERRYNIVSLQQANLSEADLSGASLNYADLYGSFLREVNLRDAYLFRADLSETDLRYADLYGSFLREAYLREADLSDAFLRGADLIEADLFRASLRKADLFRADLRETNLSYALLLMADLSGADLSGADLRYADLSGASLREADLSGADLSDAHLSGAKELTEEQLSQARYLGGATMPNGQKYEEWLKSKDRGEGGKNGGCS